MRTVAGVKLVGAPDRHFPSYSALKMKQLFGDLSALVDHL